jgi:membrane protein implicated in regulation of membrane protease activity
MPDNWGFVLAAYALTAIVLALYWRRLVRKEKQLRRTGTTRRSDRQTAERSREPSRSGHPRTEPASRGPLP